MTKNERRDLWMGLDPVWRRVERVGARVAPVVAGVVVFVGPFLIPQAQG